MFVWEGVKNGYFTICDNAMCNVQCVTTSNNMTIYDTTWQYVTILWTCALFVTSAKCSKSRTGRSQSQTRDSNERFRSVTTWTTSGMEEGKIALRNREYKRRPYLSLRIRLATSLQQDTVKRCLWHGQVVITWKDAICNSHRGQNGLTNIFEDLWIKILKDFQPLSDLTQ